MEAATCTEDEPVAASVAAAPPPASAAVAHELQGKSKPDLQVHLVEVRVAAADAARAGMAAWAAWEPIPSLP